VNDFPCFVRGGLTPAAGPGVLTRALLRLPPSRLRRLIVLENNPKFFDRIKVCACQTPSLLVGFTRR